MDYIILIFLFFLGAAFGSFGSVVVWRLMQKDSDSFLKKIYSIIFGRSYCVSCGNKLKWFNLFPLFSWIIQKGKCSFCGGNISVIYLFIEILSGIIFVFDFFYVRIVYGLNIYDLNFWIFYIILTFINFSFLLFLISDLWFYYLITPVWIVLFIFLVFVNFFNGTLYIAFVSGIIFLTFYLFIYLFGRWYVKFRYQINGEGFGFGDVMVGFLIGLALPLFIININLLSLINFLLFHILLSCIIGIFYGLINFLFFRTKSLKTSIPFMIGMIFSWYLILLIYMLKIDFLNIL